MAVLLRARRDVEKLRAAAARRRDIVAGRLYRPQFSDAQLRVLVAYKNRGVDRSVTYRLVMSPLYDKLVHLLPLWLAPNAVTLLGFALVLLSHALLVWHAPYLDTPAPSWVYVMAGLSLFTYMVLDNLDGRQARRTRASSPLGHLFDHGCDAFNVTISGISVLATLQLGQHPLWAYSLLFLTGQFVCYVASLEEYFTGAMILREINGPNEGLILMSLLHVATGLTGPQVWTQSAGQWMGVQLSWNKVLVLSMFLPTMGTAVMTYVAIWDDGRRRKQANIVLQSARASTNIAVCGLINVCWIVFAREDYTRSVVPILWLSCLNFFYLISRMIVCHLTDMKFPTLLKSVIPQALCAANAVFGHMARGGRPLLPQDALLWCALVVTAVFNGWRIYCMITQICDYLNIKCLRLGPLRAAASADAKKAAAAAAASLAAAVGAELPESAGRAAPCGLVPCDLDGLAPAARAASRRAAAPRDLVGGAPRDESGGAGLRLIPSRSG
jgi:ethanolaminephosphotransferase